MIMKKTNPRNKKPSDNLSARSKGRSLKKNQDDSQENIIDTIALNQGLAEEFREPEVSNLDDSELKTSSWDETQDRGEDLADNRDPLIQEEDFDDENLADRFDKERRNSKDM